ncbi:MAG: BON domain-containing protein [Nitrosomonas sp.]|nr:BON domain-containing protein [Nitrosomonas sp.]
MMPILSKFLILSLLLMGTLTIAGCGDRMHESWVERPAAPVYPDSLVFAKINSAVLDDPQLQGFNIKIEVTDGRVVLSGLVDTQAQADRVTMHSWIVDGAKEVDNQIRLK